MSLHAVQLFNNNIIGTLCRYIFKGPQSTPPPLVVVVWTMHSNTERSTYLLNVIHNGPSSSSSFSLSTGIKCIPRVVSENIATEIVFYAHRLFGTSVCLLFMSPITSSCWQITTHDRFFGQQLLTTNTRKQQQQQRNISHQMPLFCYLWQ